MKPYPFCGSDTIKLNRKENLYELANVTCLSCDAQTGLKNSDAEALEAWEQRQGEKPRYETPEQFKKRTGREYPDDLTVYVLVSFLGRKNWCHVYYSDAKSTAYNQIALAIVCANNDLGAPDPKWRPEE